MSQLDNSAIQSVKELVLAAHHTKELTELSCPVATLPASIDIHNLEKFHLGRFRFRGDMQTTSIDDFARYSIKHGVEDGVTCFIDAEEMKAKTIFNFGTIEKAGHADNRATITLQKTSPFKSLLEINGRKNKQKELAEWLEDWRDFLKAHDANGEDIEIKKAIGAIRQVTIESLSTQEHEDQDFSGKRSLMQSVEAKSKDVMPVEFEFKCVPYEGLGERVFRLRYSILTSDSPLFVLRIIQLETHDESMATEFRDLLTSKFKDANVETFIGKFSA